MVFQGNHIRIFTALLLFASLSSPSFSADWDAQTRRTNTSVQDSDIQAALTRGLPSQFAQTFPVNAYGIFVLIDRTNVKDLNRDLVYISPGLCKRRPDGSYNLPSVTYRTTTALPPGNQIAEHQAVIEKLGSQASEFAQLTIQNAGMIK
jgi:hypothetical protein